VQNKVLEALAMGKACVAISPPRWPVSRRLPANIYCQRPRPHSGSRPVERLLDDADFSAIPRHGRPALRREASHTWDKCLEPLAQILDI